MAGLYNGHILEFPQIRVDCFTQPPPSSKPPWFLLDPSNPTIPPKPAPPAQLFLLTHVHTDHLLGLDNQFTGRIVCSGDTKRMLLRLEAEKERDHYVNGVREIRRKKYEGLKARVVDRGTKDERVVDHIEALPFGQPKVFEIGYEDGKPIKVTITLIDANHCPGSTMFLITSSDKAVLHTGDIRADDLFLKTLRRNPAVSQFVVPPTASLSDDGRMSGRRTLDRMYIDTGAILGTGDMPDKEEVLVDLLDQMSLYPEDTVFFLNVWCFGWEDVVKEVARHFNTLVHVDRYKKDIYEAIQTDPFLAACTTLDPTASRFHACERRAKCDECRVFNKAGQKVYNLDKRIVSVNMVEVKTASWELERKAFLDRLSSAAVGEGDWPYTIDCPIARHSPLPEMQRLVKMFRPKALSPNTMTPMCKGMDYYLLPELFQDCLSSSAYHQLMAERDTWFKNHKSFGPAYLHNMKSIKATGLDILPGAIGSDVDYGTSMHSSLSIGPTKRKRSAHAAAQMQRAGGLPDLTMEDMTAIMGALTDDRYIVSSGPFKVHHISTEQKGAYDPFIGSYGSKLGGSDYDTDEERSAHSRKRRIRTFDDYPIQPETGNDPAVKTERHSPNLSDHLKQSPQPMSDTTIDRKPVIKTSPSRITPVKWSPASSKSYRYSSDRKPFVVDKEHLRALAMVAAEVDDL